MRELLISDCIVVAQKEQWAALRAGFRLIVPRDSQV